MKEIWKSIHNGTMSISNMGRLKVHARQWKAGNGTVRSLPERIYTAKTGLSSPHITITLNDVRHNIFIHSTVLKMFGPKQPSSKHIARHLDGDSSNNCIENLAWGTHRDNALDAVSHGVHFDSVGEDNPKAKLDSQKVLDIWSSLKTGSRPESLAWLHDVSVSTVRFISQGRTWSHVTGAKRVRDKPRVKYDSPIHAKPFRDNTDGRRRT